MNGRRMLTITLWKSVCKIWKQACDRQMILPTSAISRHLPTLYPAQQLIPAGFPLPQQPVPSDEDPLAFNGILLAVPKHRRTIEKKRIRSFGWLKRMERTVPKDNIVSCPKCGGWHESHTICGDCYDTVRQKTAEMRQQLEKDDAYFFDQTKHDISDLLEKNGIQSDVHTEKSRFAEELSWFNKNLKTKSG